MFQRATGQTPHLATLSQEIEIYVDDFYEYYDTSTAPLPQRQQQNLTPLLQRRPPSSSSESTRSLRRTPRFTNRSNLQSLTTSRGKRPAASQQAPTLPLPAPATPPNKAQERNLFDKSGSTTPRSFQRLVEDDSFWPTRNTHISQRTHDAILFALEAIRAGKGSDPKPLTADVVEEGARMSDLLSGLPPAGQSGNGQTQNGTSGPFTGPTPAYATGTSRTGVRTPTQIMAERTQREAERKRREDEALRIQQENVVGVVGEQGIGRRPLPSGATQAQASSSSTNKRQGSSSRQPESETINFPSGPSGRTSDTGAPSGGQQYSSQATTVAGSRRNPNIPPENNREPAPQTVQPDPSGTSQQNPRSTFPHAFERWETLSSHWEGLTSYWIRRLQENTNELNTKPIDQQMSRQITDLSAAGANLFHAVVELQRLRASSERKFQRWFFQTRQEQDQSRNREADLERQLGIAQDRQSQYNTSVGAVQAERTKAEETVREMRRELQISKEEARRAWEELGRREQEERERTIALRSGEPTLIGGVQVVPMQGIPSRQQSTAQRPSTRDGPYSGGPGPTTFGGMPQPQGPSRSQTTTTSLDSPEREQQQFTYQPEGASPAETDPFTETAHRLRHEPDTQFYETPPRPTQPATSSAAMAAAQAAASITSPSRDYPAATNGDSRRFYQQPGTDTAIYSPIFSSAPAQQPIRTGTSGTDRSDQRSYIPSTTSGSVEDDYEVNPDGSYTLDTQGRQIPYSSTGSGGQAQRPLQSEQDNDDEYDVASEIERERERRERYGGGILPRTSAAQPGHVSKAPMQPLTVPTTSAPSSSARVQSGAASGPTSPDYSGGGYDPPTTTTEQDIPRSTRRHDYPTRLSDILEERSSRTSPSRASYASAGAQPSTTAG